MSNGQKRQPDPGGLLYDPLLSQCVWPRRKEDDPMRMPMPAAAGTLVVVVVVGQTGGRAIDHYEAT